MINWYITVCVIFCSCSRECFSTAKVLTWVAWQTKPIVSTRDHHIAGSTANITSTILARFDIVSWCNNTGLSDTVVSKTPYTLYCKKSAVLNFCNNFHQLLFDLKKIHCWKQKWIIYKINIILLAILYKSHWNIKV